MTSKDVRDILQISSNPTSGPGLSSSTTSRRSNHLSSAPPNSRKAASRPAGVTRELFALIGHNAPSLALAQSTTSKPQFKSRIGMGKDGKGVGGRRSGTKWTWTAFVNPSRGAKVEHLQRLRGNKSKGEIGEGEGKGDDEVVFQGEEDEGPRIEPRAKLQLRHWVRDLPESELQPVLDSKFAKFNTSSQPMSYTDLEYDRWLRNLDPSWSKDETDHLFDLARTYDIRFIVMADRWQYNSERSVEMLKQRYYSISRELLKQRPPPATLAPEDRDKWDKQRQDAISSMQFDMNREVERKAYLRSLLSRTPKQIAEEDFLYIETRRIEQQYNKMATERAELLKILGGREGIGAAPGVPLGVGGGAKGAATTHAQKVEENKKKKGQTGWELEGLNGGGLPEGWAGEGSVRKATPAQDAANCIERHPAPSVSAPKASPWPSVGVRSSRIASVKPGVAAKVASALVELGISTHLIMPTKGNIEKLDQLQATLSQMVELKKAVDRCQAEIKTFTKKRDVLLAARGGPPVPASTSVTPAPEKLATPAPMEMDGEVKKEEQDDAGSNKADQRTKRSASVSSVGTTTKRARRD
ncbi:BQ2448_935 [Microbotryum intermedium]|uniref:SWR1-complex protein 4 n=1 Tax=Microbotryum intermedium TaxID=269621 RepID=A0A238FAA8_9BASI|nr:BQ2448_935 [Microbotryum intermedium]